MYHYCNLQSPDALCKTMSTVVYVFLQVPRVVHARPVPSMGAQVGQEGHDEEYEAHGRNSKLRTVLKISSTHLTSQPVDPEDFDLEPLTSYLLSIDHQSSWFFKKHPESKPRRRTIGWMNLCYPLLHPNLTLLIESNSNINVRLSSLLNLASKNTHTHTHDVLFWFFWMWWKDCIYISHFTIQRSIKWDHWMWLLFLICFWVCKWCRGR